MEVRNCAECGKKLSGRTDQRFCNDTCRNNYNRTKRKNERKPDHPNVPQILGIIKRNYEILKRTAPTEKDLLAFGESRGIESIGINPKFYTSCFQELSKTWFCCFEYGWHEGDNGFWEIGYYPDQVSLT